MNDAKDADDKQPEKAGGDKQLIEELIFKQDLNEIHLLIDFVSGRADRSLTTLTMPNPSKPGETMTSGQIVESISKMRYPPPEETPVINAQNAAILLMAKDRLSALAAPARGLTIAYTTMFIDAESGRSIWSRLRRWFGNRARRKRETGNGLSPAPAGDKPAAAVTAEWLPDNHRPHHDTRVDLAQRTFPGLQAHARKFRRWRDGLAFFSLFWLVLTALAYWDAGLGRSALERLDQDVRAIMEQLKDNPSLMYCPNASAAPAKTGTDVKPGDDALQTEFACRKLDYLRALARTDNLQVKEVFRCQQMGLSSLAHVWCWHWLLSGSAVDPDAAQQAEAAKHISQYVVYWPIATSILSVFTAYILPMMFALLGTLIGAFRAILNRIGANELAPRDLVRMKVGIPTGLVAGVAVGLFLGPSSAPAAGAGGVAGQLTLTASGLGFLAGYASYSFFGFLDNVIRSVFPYSATANAATMPTASPPATETRA